MLVAVCDMIKCLSVRQLPKYGITHVAVITYKDAAADSDSEITKLHYFVLPNDITSSKCHSSTLCSLDVRVGISFKAFILLVDWRHIQSIKA